jgi:RNA-directed DNA polymerase
MEPQEYEVGRSERSGESLEIRGVTAPARKGYPAGSRKRAPTSGRCSTARESDRPPQTGKQRSFRTAVRSGAPVSPAKEWNSIDWRTAKAGTRRLQMRIAKAVEEGRWGRAKALQHLLTHSFYAKALAVRRVTSNKGKRTPGVDGVVWTTTSDKMEAVWAIQQHGYRAQPLRRVRIPKKNSPKKRPLSIPCMSDRAVQAVHKMGLDPIAETLADPHSYGFREFRRCADAIERLFVVLAQKFGACWILEADIEGCFDKISHAWLLRFLPMKRRILRQWLKAGYIENGQSYPTEEGTPQGGIASPVLANMTLDGLEAAIRNALPRNGKPCKVHLIRFADDFVVTAAEKELLTEHALPAITQHLDQRGLNLSKVKTRIVHIREGFDFLGQTVRKFGDKLIIRPANAAIRSLLVTVRQQLRRLLSAPVKEVVGKLNPILRGWANYHRHVVSAQTFKFVDWRVNAMLWQWARRRHAKRSSRWLTKRYWRVHPDEYRFTAVWKEPNQKQYTLGLFRLSELPIRRHLKIRSAANPYSATWQAYFANRIAMKPVRA